MEEEEETSVDKCLIFDRITINWYSTVNVVSFAEIPYEMPCVYLPHSHNLGRYKSLESKMGLSN